LDLQAFLSLLEAIGRLPSPQYGEAQRLLQAALTRASRGMLWHTAMKTVRSYVVTMSGGARTSAPGKQKAPGKMKGVKHG
jgi:hypothetical protein